MSEKQTTISQPDAQVIDPKKKPFTMVYQGHTDNHLGKIDVFSHQVETKLQATSKKVLVVLEASNGTPAANEAVQAAIAAGALPSEALANAADLFRPVQGDNIATGYNDVRSTLLDDLATRYPKRVALAIEAHTDEDAESFNLDEKWFHFNGEATDTQDQKPLDRARATVKRFFRRVFTNKPEPGSEEYSLQETLDRARRKVAEFSTRDRNIVKTIEDGLADPEIEAGVCLVGSYHTVIGHTLREEGYSVKRVFPDAVDGIYTYDPVATFDRELRMHPEREYTRDDVRKIVRAELQFNKYAAGMTDQELARAKHQHIHGPTFTRLRKHEETRKRVAQDETTGNIETPAAPEITETPVLSHYFHNDEQEHPPVDHEQIYSLYQISDAGEKADNTPRAQRPLIAEVDE